jgi:hypothetical protein
VTLEGVVAQDARVGSERTWKRPHERMEERFLTAWDLETL